MVESVAHFQTLETERGWAAVPHVALGGHFGWPSSFGLRYCLYRKDIIVTGRENVNNKDREHKHPVIITHLVKTGAQSVSKADCKWMEQLASRWSALCSRL